jgi:hypothetical protein
VIASQTLLDDEWFIPLDEDDGLPLVFGVELNSEAIENHPELLPIQPYIMIGKKGDEEKIREAVLGVTIVDSYGTLASLLGWAVFCDVPIATFLGLIDGAIHFGELFDLKLLRHLASTCGNAEGGAQ